MNPILEVNIKDEKYIPGGKIRGSLMLNNFMYIGVKYLKIKIIGEIKNDFNFNGIFVFDEKINLFELILNYDFIINNFVYKNNNVNFLLEPCQKNINIDISLPSINLPSTYKSDNFNIKYRIVFILDYINITNNVNKIVKKEKEIYIIPLIYTFDNNYLIPTILNSFTKIDNRKIYGTFLYSVFLPFKCYLHGDLIHLQLTLDNLTNINNYIVLINISLKKQLVITQFLDFVVNNEKIFNYNKKIIHNKNNDTIIKIKDFQIPFNHEYSIFPELTKNIFEIKYILSINILICKNNIIIPLKKLDIPIIIGSFRSNYNNINKHEFLPEYKVN